MLQHKGTITLESKRLILRPFSSSDIAMSFQNWTNDEKVTTFLRWKPHGTISVTETVINGWIQQYKDPSFYQWAIVLKDSDEVIGTISVVSQDEKAEKIHVGYCIGSKWWHQGYTSEALERLMVFFFEEVKANRIESQHDPNNMNSGLVMKKCGFSYEGTLRKADWNNKGIVDACMYSILAEDYIDKKMKQKIGE